MIGGQLIGHNDPDYQERVVKFNELISNCAIYSTALDITDAANVLAAEGHPVDTDDLATISPYVTRTIRRFGDWILDLAPPAGAPSTRLDLEPRVLFPTGGPEGDHHLQTFPTSRSRWGPRHPRRIPTRSSGLRRHMLVAVSDVCAKC